jgi:hypothetical protein
MQIMYDNKIVSADISCATEDEDYPLENLFESRISRKFRTTDDADQSIVFDFGEEISLNRLAIVGHNFSEDVEIKLFTTALWTQRTSSFGTTNIMRITYGNGLYVAVGSSGKLATSPDGITWTQQTSSFGTTTIQGIAYGNGLWVAVGSSGKLATSSDGITWTQQTSSFETTTILDVAYGEGTYIAVGDSGKLATSSDGITWTQRTSSFGTTNIRRITYGNGLYVAVGLSGKLATSPDGITWTQRISGFETIWAPYGITYGDGLYVVVGASSEGTGFLATSSDGIAWDVINDSTSIAFLCICYYNFFVIGGQFGGIATSFYETILYDSNIIIHQLSETITTNKLTLFINDANSNSDGYLEIGYLYLGEYLQLPNMKIDQDLNAETTSTIAYSESGQAYGKEGYIFRQPKINFPAMTNAQKEGLQELFSTVKNITPFICAIWANRLDIEPALYCVLNQKNIAFKRSDNYNAPWATTIELREVF